MTEFNFSFLSICFLDEMVGNHFPFETKLDSFVLETQIRDLGFHVQVE